MTYNLLITGFKTREQVEEFASWYEGQGEQDSAIWFECAKEEGRIDVDHMNTDMKAITGWKDQDTFQMKLDL